MTTINRRITTPEEVTALATEPEGETVDYKGTAKPKEWWELAKDVAAFANHLGGVVLLGAFERPDGVPSLQGLPPDEVKALASAYEEVARDRCRPSPLVTCSRIPWKNGSEMLAVNVQAQLALVGAQFYASRKDTKNPDGPLVVSAANAWQFPMRVGKDNVPLPLEQAIMHMSAHARRVVILLTSIADPKKVKLVWQRFETKAHVYPPFACTLQDFSVECNVARFAVDGYLHPVSIPLDDIEAAWTDRDGWAVRVSGFFENSSQTGIQTYVSRPRGGQ